jgi:hypothetical protein
VVATGQTAVVDKIYKGCNLELTGESFKVNPMPLLMLHFSAIIEVDILFPLRT